MEHSGLRIRRKTVLTKTELVLLAKVNVQMETAIASSASTK